MRRSPPVAVAVASAVRDRDKQQRAARDHPALQTISMGAAGFEPATSRV
jgi:hypothetical protein